ncbi:glycosyltransferase family 4 protein [Sphingomonas crocodyli]|uniref:Glycosyltransferase family 1 protein n=1 Tax=Sphingomonas crocodyli TaxID=1979270 RepID=A0A437LYH8_9SPHN|nr:glycosyltransferase family 1 protein [Sphingomonas crocodyli]RVT90499.1 glycosyltransferase family 1 protein [Sphingomonas crocodyli]
MTAALRHDRFANARPALLHRGRALRVALFSGNYNCVRDGANQALNRLVGHLIDRGADVRVYSPTAKVAAFEPAGQLVSVPSLAIPGRAEYRLAMGLPASIRRDLDAFVPDIIHVSAPDLLGRKAQDHARSRGIPLVASLHTRFETYLDFYRLGWLRSRIERYLDGFYRRCDLVLAPNRAIADDIAGLDVPEVRIWSRGVDPAIFAPGHRDEAWRQAQGYRPDDPVVLLFGRIVREKGLATFVETIEAVRKRGRVLQPLIVGNGPARGWLGARLPNARFVGHLAGRDLGRAIASADVMLSASTTEAFGNVVLEAMAAGVPVISSDVPSAQALITHGRDGMLVPPGDPRAFANMLDHLLDRPSVRRDLAQAAAARAEMFRWDHCLDAVADGYLSLL